jgi:uncharacterized membrane protein SpoIIM required for sporulation
VQLEQFKALSPQLRARNRYFSKPFIACIATSFVIILSILVLSGSSGEQISMREANQILNDITGEVASLTAADIFINNAEIALFSIIPIVGSAWMGLVQYNTGYLLGNLAKAYGISYVSLLSYTLTTPVGLLEYTAYTLALSESFILVYSALRRNIKERFLKNTWKTSVIVVGVLLIAAILEARLIGAPIF